MRLGIMALAIVLAGTRDVEVAQGDRAQAISRVPTHGALEGQLGGAIWIDRACRGGLTDGHFLRLAVDRRGAAEDDTVDPGFTQGVQQADAADHVLGEVQAGILHRLSDQRARRAVQHRVDVVLLERGDHGIPIAHRDDDQLCTGRDRFAMAGHERVEGHHLVAGEDELFHGDGADVSGAAGDEDAHQRPSSRSRKDLCMTGLVLVGGVAVGVAVTTVAAGRPTASPRVARILSQSRLHAASLVVLGVDGQRLSGQLVGTLVVTVGQRALGQTDHGDGVAGIHLDDALIQVPGLVDLVDL